MSISKENLLKNLRRIQKSLCVYQNPQQCDCKFVSDNVKDEDICSFHENGSGCPEIRQVIDLIGNFGENRFVDLIKSKKDVPVSSRRKYSLAGNNCCFECSSCSSKGGWPELCTDCIRRREICNSKHKSRKS